MVLSLGRSTIMALSDSILRRVRGKGRGFVFTAADFLDLGSRSAVDQVLSRLARDLQVRRLDRGVYDYPRTLSGVGEVWPAVDVVARALARQTGSAIKPSPARAANLLGLSNQVPATSLFFTDGKNRSVTLGKTQIRLKHARPADMALPGTQAGLAVLALSFLGRDAGGSAATVQHLARVLAPRDKTRLLAVRSRYPVWMQRVFSQVAQADV
jgi:hypothetical protein